MTGRLLPGVTVVVPTIPGRARLLARALASVDDQERPAQAVIVWRDHERRGAWEARNQAARHVRTEWTAFLDDDDELLPHHLGTLLDLAADSGAGLTWGWFDVVGGVDPFPQHRGRPFDPAAPHIVPITYLVQTEALAAALAAGGFRSDPDATGAWDVQDQPLFVRCAELVGTACTAETTWLWHHHGRNTSGLPDRHRQ